MFPEVSECEMKITNKKQAGKGRSSAQQSGGEPAEGGQQSAASVEHGVEVAAWNNYGGDPLLSGWFIQCTCGWCSSPNRLMLETGAEFDAHLEATR